MLGKMLQRWNCASARRDGLSSSWDDDTNFIENDNFKRMDVDHVRRMMTEFGSMYGSRWGGLKAVCTAFLVCLP